MVKLALIGAGGAWASSNLVRNLIKLSGKDMELSWLADSNPDSLKQYQYLNIGKSINYKNLINYDINSVFIATPIQTHYEIARFFLENGKNVLVQKPISTSLKEAQELRDLAEKNNVYLQTCYTFIYGNAVNYIKNFILEEKLGKLKYFSSIRSNLGLFSHSHNIISDLAPHDLSILIKTIPLIPKWVSCHGRNKQDSVDFANITIGYDENFLATIILNWLAAQKRREIIYCGDKNTLIYNDCEEEKIKIYDAGIDFSEDNRFSYRKGDVFCPKIENQENIEMEIKFFIDILNDKKFRVHDATFPPITEENVKILHQDYIQQWNKVNTGYDLLITEMMEKINLSIEKDGEKIYLEN